MTRQTAGRSRNKQPINFWETFLFKYSTRTVLGLIIVTIFLTLVQCSIKSPEAPSWNTTFTIPVVNRTYLMDELVDKIGEDELGIDSLGNVSFSISESIDPIGIDVAQLSTGDVSFQNSQVVGIISITPPSISPFSISLSSIAGLAAGLPGDSAFVTADNFSISNNLPEVMEFTYAKLSTGQLDITIGNYLGVALDSVYIQLFDRTTNLPIKFDAVQQIIADSTTYNHTMILDTLVLSNWLRIDISGFTPGGIVQGFSTRNLTTTSTFGSSIEVVEAVAQVPAIPDLVFSEKLGLSLSQGEQIDSASLNTGEITLNVTNSTNLDATMNIVIPSLVQNGNPLSISQPVSSRSTVNIITDIANYNLIPVNDSVAINLTAIMPGSGGAQVFVQASDSLTVFTSISNLTFSSVSGIIPNNTTSFANVSQSLNTPDGFDDISFVSAVLSLNIENGVDLPGNLACTLTASNGNILEITGTIAANGGSGRQLTTITNNSIADFIDPLPDSISIGGSITFGDGAAHTITITDSIFASFDIYAPLHVRVNNAQVNDIDIEREDLDSDDMEMIIDHVVEARFIYTVTNHLPLGITAVMQLGPDSASLESSPELVLDTFFAAAAPVDPLTGITTMDNITEGEIILDASDIQILNNDILFFRPVLILNSSDPAGVLLTGSDYFIIQGRIEIDYLFDSDL